MLGRIKVKSAPSLTLSLIKDRNKHLFYSKFDQDIDQNVSIVTSFQKFLDDHNYIAITVQLKLLFVLYENGI